MQHDSLVGVHVGEYSAVKSKCCGPEAEFGASAQKQYTWVVRFTADCYGFIDTVRCSLTRLKDAVLYANYLASTSG